MSSEEPGGFDLTPVIQLLHLLSPSGDELSPDASSDNNSEVSCNAASEEDDEDRNQLGKFDKLWNFLGRPLNAPPPAIVPTLNNDKTLGFRGGSDITGTLVEKAVRWRDEIGNTPLEDTEEFDSAGSNTNIYKGSAKKKQYLKKRDELRALKRTKEAHTNSIVTRPTMPPSNDIGSESELPDVQKSHKRRSVIQRMLYNTSIELDATPKTKTAPKKGHQVSNLAPLRIDNWPISNPFISITTPELVDDQTALAQFAAKLSRLVAKLYERFIDERSFLNNPSLLLSKTAGLNDNVSFGVHVFVDASNIMIGFHDALKESRGLSRSERISRQPISFYNLSLILERGRPTAKRVLVGSDNFSAIQEAKSLGYETNILDRVHKAKELTSKQMKYNNGRPRSNSGNGQSSGSETNAPTYAPERWVEQAVDEILHLKMLESIVDTKSPSTIVLATGDAAEAEYSQGFMKMVERALEHGWRVELVSFTKNTSYAYRKKEFRQKWGTRFTIVELDEFVQEILETGG
ncbi:MAG: hypothetical protein MMC33_005414 [Icmadophila ericetorum]|nr:hypothetical protein [Icmadophila ericetorum]